jgi:hypothetical protein
LARDHFEQRPWLWSSRRLRWVGVAALASSGVLAGCDEDEGDTSRGVPIFDWSGPVAPGSGGQGAVGESSGGAGGRSNGSETAAGGGSEPGGAGGSTEEPWGTPPTLWSRVGDEDLALGREVLGMLGSSAVGSSGSCSSCHTLGRPTLTRWLSLTRDLETECLSDVGLADRAAVDAMYECLERHAGRAVGFAASDFGIYAVATQLPWFSFLLERASATAADAQVQKQQLGQRVGMPRSGQAWTQAEFDRLAEWFSRGLPGLFELVPEDSGDVCTPGLDARLASHVVAMRSQGWRARNEEVPLLMFGCAAGQSGRACLSNLPAAAAQSYGAGWDVVPNTAMRILHDNSDAPSSYWSRCSPDGRFIASGLAEASDSGSFGQFLDLQRNVAFDGDFDYDATFFPDSSGFVVQRGGQRPDGGGAVSCNQSVLLGNPERFTGNEPACSISSGRIGLYQQPARTLDGSDYWVVFGAFDDDDGGFSRTLQNPGAAFESRGTTSFVRMLNQGAEGFTPGPTLRVPTPLQGDPMLSPSGRLLATRVKGEERIVRRNGMNIVTADQSGYALHLVNTTLDGTDPVVSLSPLGSLCIVGGKPTFSYDERWMLLHHYVTAGDAIDLGFTGAADPGFDAYERDGASNIVIVDLASGQSRRITHTAPGQYALFPHFRSDGWIYFVVRTLQGDEYFVASDAALSLEAAAESSELARQSDASEADPGTGAQ